MLRAGSRDIIRDSARMDIGPPTTLVRGQTTLVREFC